MLRIGETQSRQLPKVSQNSKSNQSNNTWLSWSPAFETEAKRRPIGDGAALGLWTFQRSAAEATSALLEILIEEKFLSILSLVSR